MAELAERVAKLEQRFDGVTAAIADLKAAVGGLDANMQAGFAEVRKEFGTIRSDIRIGLSEARAERAAICSEMNTQYRWILGSVGTAALAVIVAVLTAILAKG